MTTDARTIADSPKSSCRDGFRAFAFIAILLAAVYSSALSLPYGFMDDYRCLELTREHNPKYILTSSAQGRPLNGLLIDFALHRSWHIEGFRGVRLATVLILATLGWAAWDQMRQGGWPRSIAMSLAVLLTTMPAAQVYAAFATAIGLALGSLAGAGAAVLAARAVRIAGAAQEAESPGIEQRRQARRTALRPAAGAAATLLVALMLYQPGAMMYWVFAAIRLFSPRRKPTRLRWLELAWYGGIAVPALVMEFIAFKIGQAVQARLKASPAFGGPTIARAGLVFHWGMILPKLHWFFAEALTNALNFTNILPSRPVALAAAIFILLGLAFYFGGWRSRPIALAVAIGLIPLAFFPNLLTAENWASYRSQIALVSLLALYLILALQGWWKLAIQIAGHFRESFVPAWLPMMAALASAAMASYFVTAYFAWPQTLELKLVQGLLGNGTVATAYRIVIIPPDWSDTPAPGIRYDEFGQPSTNKPWAAHSMVELILRERHHLRPDLVVELATGSPDQALAEAGPEVLVLDLRTLGEFRWSILR